LVGVIKPFDPSQYKTKRPMWRNAITLSLVAIVVLLALMKALTTLQLKSGDDFNVYCSDGLLEPVKEAAAAFEKEFQVQVKFEFGSSEHLQAKMEWDEKEGATQADIYLSDDAFTVSQVRETGRISEFMPLASFRLVFASKPSANLEINSLDDIIEKRIPFAIRHPDGGVGQTTMQALLNVDKWRNFHRAKKASYATDKETADAIQNNDAIQAGFVWSTTAKATHLTIHDLPELKEAGSMVSANVVSSSKKATLALLFARYLAAPEKGQKLFEKHHFTPRPGDPWIEKPELHLFCGSVNQDALEATISSFEKREGCKVHTRFDGSGALSTRIKAIETEEMKGSMPDVFMSSDLNHMNKVEELFGEVRMISSTEIVLLSRRDNPKITANLTLDHLSEPNLMIGIANPEKSALGTLSWELLQGWGVSEKIKTGKTFRVRPSSKELIREMKNAGNLDVAMVYESDCKELTKEEFRIDFIEDELARPIQVVASAPKSPYPQLANRLVDAINSTESKNLYLQKGFLWKADDDR
jgi:molybdate transport system substrate-binding protein